MSASRPIIAIVGRPNVGKSTLFNRLVKRRMAIVENTPGVTRDRHYADTELHNRAVTIVDTGGFVPDFKKEDPLAEHIRLQAQAAVEECDVVLFVCDGRAGVTAEDGDVAKFLRRQKRPVVLVVNKCDNYQVADTVSGEFHKLGLKTLLPVSAEHNEGIEALLDATLALLPEVGPALAPKRVERREFDQGDDRGLEDDEEEGEAEEPEDDAEVAEEPVAVVEEEPDRPMRVAIVGRPNVGKSTLVNSLLGQKRVIVSPIAGTTRDAIDTELSYKGKPVVLTDTAGIRRKAAISQKVEHFSVLGAMRAIEDSDVAVLVLDAGEPAVEQDLKIAALAESKGRALLICVNKWDLVKGKVKEEIFRDQIKWYLKFVAWAPMVFVSAKDNDKVNKVLDLALQLFEQQYFRAGTPLLNKIIDHVTTEHPLPMIARGRQLRLYYAAQVGTAPPSFAVICNAPKEVPERYERYVTNYLRETFRLKVPVRLFWRERPGGKKRLERAKRFAAREKSKRR